MPPLCGLRSPPPRPSLTPAEVLGRLQDRWKGSHGGSARPGGSALLSLRGLEEKAGWGKKAEGSGSRTPAST